MTLPGDEPRTTSQAAARRLLPAVEAVVASAATTALVVLASHAAPERFVATAVGLVFLLATWVLVWRKDDAFVRACGLSLGGLVLPGPLDRRGLARSAGVAIASAFGVALLTFAPFYFGWRAWWAPNGAFSLVMSPAEAMNEVFGQIVVIALPEEAFYRGYLQSRFDQQWPNARLRIAGAPIGPGLVLASAIFALGHLATIHQPTRLAVFFPSLVFGWLRARTGGIGASLTFHALCNLFSEALGRGYGVY